MLPPTFAAGQRFKEEPFSSSIQLFDQLDRLGSIDITKSTQGQIDLRCSGHASTYSAYPIAELTAQLCANANSCRPEDVRVTWSNGSPLHTFDMSKIASNSGDEIIDWMGSRWEVLLPLPRRVVYQHRILHRGFGALLVHAKTNEIFVHKRSSRKSVCPSVLDMFVGGMSAHREPVLSTLIRELDEEVGVDLKEVEMPHIDYHPSGPRFATQVVHLGDVTVSHALVDLFLVKLAPMLADNMHFRDGEIEWGEWMSLDKLRGLLEGEGREQFVPDGRLAWAALPGLLADSPHLRTMINVDDILSKI